MYPHTFPARNIAVAEFVEKYSHLGKGQDLADVEAGVAGRIYSIRSASRNLHFIDIGEGDARLQVKASAQTLGQHVTDMVGRLRRGDILGVRGHPTRTKAGELSLAAAELQVLAPCLHTMPRPHHKLENTDKRFRRRYLDFMVNPECRQILRTRAAVLAEIRAFLDEEGFLEVETPVLTPGFGGAAARPFRTHHHAHDADVCLRVAPELHLKKLIVGGFERVYEMGRQFRNEGADSSHNPEFTSCELYAAYADYNDMMALTAKLLRRVAGRIHGRELKVPYSVRDRPVVLDFKSKFGRHDYLECLESALGRELPALADVDDDGDETRAFLFSVGLKAGVDMGQARTSSQLLDKLFGRLVEPELVQPTFVVNYPQAMSPLAKPHRSLPRVAERFELFAAGKELANAYTELNDPALQRELFRRQRADRDSVHVNPDGDLDFDEEFVHALEYGLPPTAGWGMGVDRLVMLLTGETSIKEVLAFPAVRQIASKND